MRYVSVRIPRYRVCKNGHLHRTGTTIKRVPIRKKQGLTAIKPYSMASASRSREVLNLIFIREVDETAGTHYHPLTGQ